MRGRNKEGWTGQKTRPSPYRPRLSTAASAPATAILPAATKPAAMPQAATPAATAAAAAMPVAVAGAMPAGQQLQQLASKRVKTTTEAARTAPGQRWQQGKRWRFRSWLEMATYPSSALCHPRPCHLCRPRLPLRHRHRNKRRHETAMIYVMNAYTKNMTVIRICTLITAKHFAYGLPH
jgi:hypothetical protein